MNCEECRKNLVEYMRNELGNEVRRAVDGHVSDCSGCARELACLTEAWEALGDIPDEEPSPRLSARFYSMLEEAKRHEAHEHGRSKGIEGWLAGWWPRRPAFQFVTALLLLAVGLAIGLGLSPDDGRDAELAMLRAEIRNTQQVMTLALVNQTASADRLAAISSIRKDREAAQPAVDALIYTLKSDPNVNVRLAAVDALSGFLDRDRVRNEMNLALVGQTSPMVQVSLIEALSGAEDEQLLQTLRSIAQDERADPFVRELARTRIEKKL